MTTDYQPTERRPIATRQASWARAVAGWLVRRNVSPNAISVAGMLAGVLAGVALAMTAVVASDAVRRVLWLAGAGLVQLRLLANMLDGMVAVESGKASPVGELYNEIPDRVSDAATLVGLGYAAGASVTLGYVATLLAVFTAYVRAQGKAAGAPTDFCGPMAKQHRMFVVTLTAVLMAALPATWQVGFGPAGRAWGLPAVALAIVAAGCVVTVWRRLVRVGRALRGGAAR